MSEDMRKHARGDVAVLTALLVGGVLVAVLWRVIDPATAKLGDSSETGAAVDGTLALLGILAGLLTGAFVILRPGSRPVLRTLVAIAGSAVAGLIAWKLGDVFGKPHLRADGAAFTWPVATSAAVFLGALMPWSATTLNHPVQNAAPEPGPAGGRSAFAAGHYHPPAEQGQVNGHGGPPGAFGRPAPGEEPAANADQPPWRAPDA
jgi:divalent metal cation (Fe/Co/Zn/Cd) transporter